MIYRRTLLTVACLAVLGGCNQGGGYKPEPPKEVAKASVTAGSETELWPLAEGNLWVYEVQTAVNQGSGQRDLTFKVTRSRKEGDATIATIEVLEGTKHIDSSDWKIDKNGIYQLTSTDQKATYNPPQMLAKFPIKPGETFHQDVNGPAAGTSADPVMQSIDTTCRGTERVDTAQGPMEGVAFESKTTFTYKDKKFVSQATLWFVPKVGLARFVQETASDKFSGKEIFRLKSHTAK